MPMLDIQRRHQTVFRIRFGEKSERNGKTFPTKLTDAIRVTSANPDVVDAFIEIYGGTRTPWQEQFEAKLPTTALNILVLPGQSISQWWEKYRGSVCDRRCDGQTETKSKKPCMCESDVEARTADSKQCSPTTRVSVICPDVAVVGSGMFVCHGLVGAETLPQSIAVAEAALSRGLMVPAVLRVVEFRGLNHFIVPQIEVVGMSFNALAAATATGELQHATKELDAPEVVDVGAGPRFTPINAGAAPAVMPGKPLRDQFGEFDEQSAAKQSARGQRANAAAPLPATGVQVFPRGGSPDAAEGGGGDVPESLQGARVADGPGASPQPAADAPELVNDEGASNVARRCADAGVGDDRRRAFLWAFSGGRYDSSKQVPVAELGDLFASLAAIRKGEIVLFTDPGGEVEPWLGLPEHDKSAAVQPDVDHEQRLTHKPDTEPAPPVAERAREIVTDTMWRELLATTQGVGPIKLLRRARDLAVEHDLEPPKSIAEIPAVLADELKSWLAERSAA